MKPARFLLPAVLLASAALSGCAAEAYYDVPAPPPPPVAGPVGPAPGPGYVWIDGFYNLRRRSWMWVPGYWVRPPYPHAVWEKPRWERHGRAYRFHRGRWRR